MKYLIYILFLYFIGALEFLGSISLLVGCHYLFLLIGLGSFAYYIIVNVFLPLLLLLVYTVLYFLYMLRSRAMEYSGSHILWVLLLCVIYGSFCWASFYII